MAVPIFGQVLKDRGWQAGNEERLELAHGREAVLVAVATVLQEDVGAGTVYLG